MNTKEVMKTLRAKHLSWYRVAKILDISQPSVYELRDGQSVMSNKVARRAAEDLNIPMEMLICEAEIERATRAKDAEEVSAWKKRLEDARQRAAVVVCAIIAAYSSHSTESTASSLQVNTLPPSYGAMAEIGAKTLYYVNSLRAAILRIAAQLSRSATLHPTPCA